MIKKIIIIVLLILAVWYVADNFTIKPTEKESNLDFVKLPQNFHIEVFADDLQGSKISRPGPNPGPRMLTIKDNSIFVSVPSTGEIIVLEDKNQDSKVESKKVFINNLKKPHGIAFYKDWIYIAEEDKVIRVKNENNAANLQTVEKLVDLPSGGHWTRTIKIIDNSLFISIGSSCNVCIEEEEMRATLQKCNLDGTNCKAFATGTRNAVDFIEYNNKIYATENSRDGLGENIPPDEINILQEGKNYGWPNCYGKKIHDTEFDKNIYIRDPCLDTESSFVDLQAHSAPLGLLIYQSNKFPLEYQGKMFVAFHGSWDRDEPTGYKIVSIDLQNKEVKDFATGWLSDLTVKGRPVGLIEFRGDVLVSDDNTGRIYRIYYNN